MAFENLYITYNRTIGSQSDGFDGGRISLAQDKTDRIAVDGVLNETTTYTATPTEQPIEDGRTVTDHVIRLPRRYTMNAVFTDTPVGLKGAVDALKGTIGGVADAHSNLFGASTDGATTRSRAQFLKLEELMEKESFVSVQTGLGLLNNMILTSLTVNQDKDTSRSIHFTAEFKQIIVVKSLTVGGGNESTADDGGEVKIAGSFAVADEVEEGVVNNDNRTFSKQVSFRIDSGDRSFRLIDSDQMNIISANVKGLA